ncbi:MAG: hypothetical protein WBC33_07830 [Conexibacter sp.]
MITPEQARRKYESLQRMSTANGCTPGESSTAARLADALAKKYGFVGVESGGRWRVDFEESGAPGSTRAAV